MRRAVCGLSRKNYNKVFSQQLKKLVGTGPDPKSFSALLAEASGDGSRWPSDEEFRGSWMDAAIYPGRLDAAKLRAIFHRLETAMRTEKTEESVPLNMDSLDIDHILPQSWSAHWPLADGTNASVEDLYSAELQRFSGSGLEPRIAEIIDRGRQVARIGNLTMVHYGVNRSLQNHGFGEKRQALFEHSNLQINRAVTLCAFWDEAAILARSELLFGFACKTWQGPG